MARHWQVRIAPPEWSWMEKHDGRDWFTEVRWDAGRGQLDWYEGPTGRARDFEAGGIFQNLDELLRRGPPSFAHPPDELLESVRAWARDKLRDG